MQQCTNQSMEDLNDLYYFVQVVRNGGFAPAGRALGLSLIHI